MTLRKNVWKHTPWALATIAWKYLDAGTCIVLVIGILLGYVFRYVPSVSVWHSLHRSKEDPILYSLDHGMLNLPLKDNSMWMNMGYWKDTDTFVEACENLLELMLKKAGVGKYEGQTIRNRPPRLLLDLGCGCGDSSIYLSRPIPDCKNHDHSACQIVDKYVGLTLDMKQHKLAKRRLESARLNTNPKLQRHLFCADAARPSEWSSALKGQLRGVVTPTAAPQVPTGGRPRGRVFINDPRRNNGGRVVTPRGRSDGVDEVCPDPRPVEKWILALDCLYHFAPSRQAIFQYGNRELGASIMAFDLILAPDISMFDWYRLWLLTLFISAPISNFVTAEQYKEQLIEAGYSDVNISIEDITPDCFAPLVRFLGERDKDLQRIGVYSFGKFRMAKRMFSWFAKGNVVRACVIVAKL